MFSVLETFDSLSGFRAPEAAYQLLTLSLYVTSARMSFCLSRCSHCRWPFRPIMRLVSVHGCLTAFPPLGIQALPDKSQN